MKFFKSSICSVGVTTIIVLLTLGFKPVTNFQKTTLVSNIDTISFTSNIDSGWSIYSVYLNGDNLKRVEFELIIKQINKINWRTEHFIGTITNAEWVPEKEQRLTYKLLENSIWHVLVQPSGKCYLKLIQGDPPPDKPGVIPIKVRYKK